MTDSASEDGDTESQAFMPPCLTCAKPLVCSVAERYMKSHNSDSFGCDDCKQSKKCKDGFYQCVDCSSDVCDACYVKRGGKNMLELGCDKCPQTLVKSSASTKNLNGTNYQSYYCSKCKALLRFDDGHYRCEKDYHENFCLPCIDTIRAEKVPCSELCKTALEFKTQEPYRPHCFKDLYHCTECDSSKECSKGYYGCRHNKAFYCEPCGVAKGNAERALKEMSCGVGGCTKKLEHSISDRTLSPQDIGIFLCLKCKRYKDCAHGYYRCADSNIDHAESDICENCFVLEGGVATVVPKPKCTTCPDNLQFSVKRRYLKSHKTSQYNCNSCSRSFECQDGYYRCKRHAYDMCQDCYEKQDGHPGIRSKIKFDECCSRIVMAKIAPSHTQDKIDAALCNNCNAETVAFPEPVKGRRCFMTKHMADLYYRCSRECQETRVWCIDHTITLNGRYTRLNAEPLDCFVCQIPMTWMQWSPNEFCWTKNETQFDCPQCGVKKLAQKGYFTCVMHDEKSYCGTCMCNFNVGKDQGRGNKIFPTQEQIEAFQKQAKDNAIFCVDCLETGKKQSFEFTQLDRFQGIPAYLCVKCNCWNPGPKGYFSCPDLEHKDQCICQKCWNETEVFTKKDQKYRCTCGCWLMLSLDNVYWASHEKNLMLKYPEKQLKYRFCSECQMDFSTKDGFYSCMKRCNVFCPPCFFSMAKTQSQMEDLRHFTDFQNEAKSQLQLKPKVVRKHFHAKAIEAELPSLTHEACGSLFTNQGEKRFECSRCLDELNEAQFLCGCKLKICKGCYMTQVKKIQLKVDIIDENSEAQEISSETSYRIQKQEYLDATSKQRLKKVQSQFRSAFWNPLCVYSNEDGEHDTFFVVKESYCSASKLKRVEEMTEEHYEEQAETLVEGLEFEKNEALPEPLFVEKLNHTERMFKNMHTFDEFFDEKRRQHVLKHLVTHMSKSQAKELCKSIIKNFTEARQAFEAEQKAINSEDEDRIFSGDMFQNEPTLYNGQGETPARESLLLQKYSMKDNQLKLLEFCNLPTSLLLKTSTSVEILLQKTLTGESQFFADDKSLTTWSMRDLSKTSFALNHNFCDFTGLKNFVLLRNKFLICEAFNAFENDHVIMFQRLHSDRVADILMKVKKEKNVDRLYLIPNETLLPDQYHEDLTSRSLEEFNLNFLYEQFDENNSTKLFKLTHAQLFSRPDGLAANACVPAAHILAQATLVTTFPQNLSDIEFTRDGNNAFCLIGKDVHHISFANGQTKVMAKYSDLIMPKSMASRRINFIFDINKSENKIMARQDFSVFQMGSSNNIDLPPLIQTGFSTSEKCLLDICQSDNTIKVLGFDSNERKIKLVCQNISDGKLEKNPALCFLEAQLVYCQYPILVTVFANSLLVQNFAQPEKSHIVDLPDGSKFVQFVNFKTLSDIGFQDKRVNIFDQTTYDQLYVHVAFTTKEHGVCRDTNCKKGDIVINMLEVDPYSTTIQCKLYRSPYEACMEGGTRDDQIIKSFAIKAISDRGNDAVLVSQYNDCIIFDCVTSTLQRPIKCPLNEDEVHEGEWADLPACIGGTMVKVPMLMDETGSLLWLVTKAKEVQVLRHDSSLQMGNSEYISSVFTLYTDHVYFFKLNEGLFYLMDHAHSIKVLRWQEDIDSLVATKTLKYINNNPSFIEKTVFDDYIVSHKVMHNKDKMYFMFDSRFVAGETHLQENVLKDTDKFVRGPWTVPGSGMALTETSKEFVLFPLGDKSNIDFLPIKHHQRRGFFASYIGKSSIIAVYGGSVLLFDRYGTFIQRCSLSSSFKPYADSFVVSDIKTFLTDKFNDNFALHRFDLKWKKVSNDDNALEGFCFDFSGTVTNKHLAERFDKDFVQQLNQGIYEEDQRGEYLSKKRLLQPYYSIKDGTLGTYTWKLLPQTGLLIYRTMQKDDQNWDEPPILFDLCNGAQRNEMLVNMFESQQFMMVKFNQTKKNLIKLTQKLSMADRQVLLDRLEVNFVQFIATENFYVLKIFSSLFFVPTEGMVQQPRNLKNLIKKTGFAKLAKNMLKAAETLQTGEAEPEQQPLLAQYTVIHVALEEETQKIMGIHKTSDPNLVQIEVCDFELNLQYVITWNLQSNHQFSLCQGSFLEGKLPVNYLINSESKDTNSLNYLFNQGAIIDLRTNVPIQFLDKDTQASLLPEVKFNKFNQARRVTPDFSRFLDTNVPGRQHSFISLSEFVYWERFQTLKTKHEIYSGKVVNVSPLLRFPQGKSMFQQFLKNPIIIKKLVENIRDEQNECENDYFHQTMPLCVLYRNPVSQPITALDSAIDQKLMSCFNNMLSLVISRRDVHVSSFLKNNLQEIIDSGSPFVDELLKQAFVVTEMFDDPVLLYTNEDQETILVTSDTTFLNQSKLQKLVCKTWNKNMKDEPKAPKEDNNFNGQNNVNNVLLGTLKAVGAESVVNDFELQGKVKKQMKAKVLDLDFLTEEILNEETGLPSGETRLVRFMQILTDTPNDQVFSTSNVRLLIDFLWERYFDKILKTLYLPYCAFLLSFQLISIFFSDFGYVTMEETPLNTVMSYICYAAVFIFGGNYVRLEAKEAYEDIKRTKRSGDFNWTSYLDFWNAIDLLTIVLVFTYVFASLYDMLIWTPSDETAALMNVVGAAATLLMWTKLFYWMRLFKPFAFFIRMIKDMIGDSMVFMCMLMLIWAGYANVLIVLNRNRVSEESIYDRHFNIDLLDSFLNSYMLGLGEFALDNFDVSNNWIMWVLFVGATFMIQIVFMNVLIAIMSETYGNIKAISEQSLYREMVSLMNDYVFLASTAELFEGNKYLVWIATEQEESTVSEIETNIERLRETLQAKQELSEDRIVNLIKNDISAVQATLMYEIGEIKKDLGKL